MLITRSVNSEQIMGVDPKKVQEVLNEANRERWTLRQAVVVYNQLFFLFDAAGEVEHGDIQHAMTGKVIKQVEVRDSEVMFSFEGGSAFCVYTKCIADGDGVRAVIDTTGIFLVEEPIKGVLPKSR